jgi:hypothetical protein
MIANRIQEEAFGTLDRATLKLLDGLARRDGARRGERNLKIGTVLVRDYQGRRHTVTVAPEGIVWEGKPYSSLSAIARAITGTVWNGPRFWVCRRTTPRQRSGIASLRTKAMLPPRAISSSCTTKGKVCRKTMSAHTCGSA